MPWKETLRSSPRTRCHAWSLLVGRPAHRRRQLQVSQWQVPPSAPPPGVRPAASRSTSVLAERRAQGGSALALHRRKMLVRVQSSPTHVSLTLVSCKLPIRAAWLSRCFWSVVDRRLQIEQRAVPCAPSSPPRCSVSFLARASAACFSRSRPACQATETRRSLLQPLRQPPQLPRLRFGRPLVITARRIVSLWPRIQPQALDGRGEAIRWTLGFPFGHLNCRIGP